MTTDDTTGERNVDRLAENLSKVEDLSERLINALSSKRQIDPNLQAPGQDLLMKTSAALWSEWLSHPSKIFEQQIAYWGKSVQHFIEAQEALATCLLYTSDAADD